MEDEKQIEQDRQRAEVFDALGHPTRILILKVLSEGSLGFADLKKRTAIESSGHLQHHLTKLNGLIKTDEFGKYCLSDEGKDALLTVQTVENASPNASTKNNIERKAHRYFSPRFSLKSVAFLLVALLIASSAIAIYEYNQATVFQRDFASSNLVNLQAMAYCNELGIIPVTTNVNSSFTPPISMYLALQIALQAGGWNKTSLSGMTVGAYLSSMQTLANGDTIALSPLTNITNIPSDYSDVYANGITYRYVWQITVESSTEMLAPFSACCLVDASTGQIIT